MNIRTPSGYPPVDFPITIKNPSENSAGGTSTHYLKAQQGLSLYENRDRKFLDSMTEPYPSDEDIVRWAKETREYMHRKGEVLSKEALQYWVRYFFDPSQEVQRWVYVCDRIEALL